MSASSGFHGQSQQTEDQLPQQQQQSTGQNSNNDASGPAASMQLPSSNGMTNVNNTLNSAPATSSSSAIAGLLHQNSMNSRQQNNANSPYGGNSVQMPSPSPSSSSTMPQPQPNPSPFQSPTPSSSNNPPQTSLGGLSTATHVNSVSSPNVSMQQPALSSDTDANDSQSSVQKIIHEMMMSSQIGGGMMGVNNLGNDVKNVNGILPTTNMGLNNNNCLVGNGVSSSNTGLGGTGFGSMTNGLGQAAMVNGIRAALGSNSMSMNGRVGMSMARDQSMNQQQDLGNQLLSGLGAVNGYNNLQFDWKGSP